MECTRHPGVASAGFCTQCGRPLCASCLQAQASHPVCPDCSARAQAPGPAPVTAPPLPATPTPYQAAPPRPASSRGPSPALWIGLGCGLLVLAGLLVAGTVLGLRYLNTRAQTTVTTQPTTVTQPGAKSAAPDAATPGGSDKGMAEARRVVEAFIELDKVHDGEAMAKLLAGQAAADFRADLQGQGDAETVEEGIAEAQLVTAGVARFKVKTVSKDLATGELSTVHDLFTFRQTDAGWKITEIQYE